MGILSNAVIRPINAAGLALIKKHEGLRLEAYVCPGGIITIGFGHTGDVSLGEKITVAEAERLLQRDLHLFENAVQSLVRVPLNDNQFATLVSFSFNVGVQALARSTLLNLLNRQWYQQVPAQLLKWTTSNGRVLAGLISRRRDEAALWSTPIKGSRDEGTEGKDA
jgi:lysozyme